MNPFKGMAVSTGMLNAAQKAYTGGFEYGLSDTDMKKAIMAALKVAASEYSLKERSGNRRLVRVAPVKGTEC